MRHEVVHNKFVVNNLREQGAIDYRRPADVPPGSTPLIYSAHGVPLSVRAEAEQRGLRVFDATCPLVTKVHVEVPHARRRPEIVMIGHAGHPEVEGTTGQSPDGMYLVETVADVATLSVRNPQALAYVSQTTLSVDETRDIIDALRARFPGHPRPEKTISATPRKPSGRRRALTAQCDLVIVVGSPNAQLQPPARSGPRGVTAYMVDNASEPQAGNGSPRPVRWASPPAPRP